MRTENTIVDDFLRQTVSEWSKFRGTLSVYADSQVMNAYVLWSNGYLVGRVLYIRDVPQVATLMTPYQAGL